MSKIKQYILENSITEESKGYYRSWRLEEEVGTVASEGLWKRWQDLGVEPWLQLAKVRLGFRKEETSCATAWKCAANSLEWLEFKGMCWESSGKHGWRRGWTTKGFGYLLKDFAIVGKLLKNFYWVSIIIIIVFKRPLRTVWRIKAEWSWGQRDLYGKHYSNSNKKWYSKSEKMNEIRHKIWEVFKGESIITDNQWDVWVDGSSWNGS